MTKVPRGTVHGKTIELENDTGLEDGRTVEVILRAKGASWTAARLEARKQGNGRGYDGYVLDRRG